MTEPIDGLGGVDVLTSKAAIIGPASRPVAVAEPQSFRDYMTGRRIDSAEVDLLGEVREASFSRTARRIMDGTVFIR